jgi:hypothetical protein
VWTSHAPSWDKTPGTCRQKNLVKLAKNGTCAPGSGGECGSSLPPAETHPEGALRWLGRLEARLVANGSETAVALAVELAGEWQPDEQSGFVWLMTLGDHLAPGQVSFPAHPFPVGKRPKGIAFKAARRGPAGLERLRACAQHRPRSSRRAPAARHPAAQGATPQRRRRREV